MHYCQSKSWYGRQSLGRANLQKVVLHDIPDDAKLVKVAAAPLRAEGLLEADLDVADVIPVPCWLDEVVGKPAGASARAMLRRLSAQTC